MGRDQHHMDNFEYDIANFNEMYGLHAKPGDSVVERLQHFKSIILEEVEEVEEVIGNIIGWEELYKEFPSIPTRPSDIDFMVPIADWLGDMLIYCASEMNRFGIPIAATLDIIMNSNMSKLGADGKPIYDERGKLLKGPNFVPPEPRIKQLLLDLNEQVNREEVDNS